MSESLNLSSPKQGLQQGFVDKNKYERCKNVAVEMESSAIGYENMSSEKETFNEFLRSSTSFISKKIYSEKGNKVKLLNPVIKNDKIVILAPDKESITVIPYKSDYIRKGNNIIAEGIQGIYTETIQILPFPWQLKASPRFSLQAFKEVRTW